MVLLIAAALKLYAGLRQPQEVTAWSIVQVEAEWLLALWLLSGLWVRAAWVMSMTAFGAFACVSLLRALEGREDCGCFGPLQVNPWMTMGLDILILIVLAAFFPRARDGRVPSRSIIGVAIGAAMLGGVGAAIALGQAAPARLDADGRVTGAARSVALEPGDWVGKRFPLLEHTDIAGSIAHGRWTALLYRHDCPACQREIESLIAQPRNADQPRVAAIELPPYDAQARSPRLAAAGIKHGRLDDARDWLVQTPLTIELNDGNVVEARQANPPAVAASLPQTEEPSVPESAATPRASGTEHHFGYVEPGGVRRIIIEIRNQTDRDWDVKAARAECSCTRIESFPKLLLPGQTGEVVIEFAAPTEVSEYSKRVFLVGHATEDPLTTLTIRASVGLPLVFEPSRLKLSELKSLEEPAVRITNRGDKPVRLLYSTSEVAGVAAVVPRDAIPAGGSRELPVRIKSDARGGGALRVHTSNREQPTIEIVIQ